MSHEDLLRHLPAIERCKGHPSMRALDLPDALRTRLCRDAVAEVRAQIVGGQLPDAAAIDWAVSATLERDALTLRAPLLRRVINGTGVLLHTGAGRAPLPAAALEAMTETARGYSNLEISLHTGKRGSRQDHLRPLLRWLTGAEDALCVNNGAAAVLLALHALARDRSVLVSRGELVEIGGGFRIPEVLGAAGARLHEVGTTNRTHLRDYEEALAQPARGKKAIAAILAVHRSNFAVVGFTAQPTLAELAELAHRHDLPLICDLGSGALQPDSHQGPTVVEVLQAGADLVTFSGDKLLGGPQAGVIVGKSQWISRLAGRPLARALRVDGLVLAGLEQVLRLHLRGQAQTALPVLAVLGMSEAAIETVAQRLGGLLRLALGADWQIAVDAAQAQLGGGTDPLAESASRCLVLAHQVVGAAELQERLFRVQVPVLGRVRGRSLLLDLRTLLAGSHGATPEQLAAELAQSLAQAVAAAGRSAP